MVCLHFGNTRESKCKIGQSVGRSVGRLVPEKAINYHRMGIYSSSGDNLVSNLSCLHVNFRGLIPPFNHHPFCVRNNNQLTKLSSFRSSSQRRQGGTDWLVLPIMSRLCLVAQYRLRGTNIVSTGYRIKQLS